MKLLKSPLAAVLMTVLLIAGYDAASYAANGQSVLLGKSNTATKITKVKRTTPGPVLALKGRGDSPPLKVGSTGRVTNLNADLVDGRDAADLETHGRTFDLTTTVNATSNYSWPIAVAPGDYVAVWQGYIGGAAGAGDVDCTLRETPNARFLIGNVQHLPHNYGKTISGAGLVRIRAGQAYTFLCNSSAGPFQVDTTGGMTLTFVPLVENTTTTVPGVPS